MMQSQQGDPHSSLVPALPLACWDPGQVTALPVSQCDIYKDCHHVSHMDRLRGQCSKYHDFNNSNFRLDKIYFLEL